MSDLDDIPNLNILMDKDRGARIKRILEAKKQPPEYQRLDIEPKEGGKSLLHDEFGLPKVPQAPVERHQPLVELPNEPVAIKAVNTPEQPKAVQLPNYLRTNSKINTKRIAQSPTEDDGFVPPKSNFVAVGQIEHSWYDDKVAGKANQPMIDNNDEVDVDGLQGLNPIAEVDSTTLIMRKKYEEKFKTISSAIVAKIDSLETLVQLDSFKRDVFGKGGLITRVLKSFGNLLPDQRATIGDLANSLLENVKLEFEAKELELISNNDSEEYEEYQEAEEGPQPPQEDEESYSPPSNDKATKSTNVLSTVKEGNYAIFVDGDFFEVSTNVDGVKNILAQLVLNNDIAIERLMVVKVIPIDFGISLRGE